MSALIRCVLDECESATNATEVAAILHRALGMSLRELLFVTTWSGFNREGLGVSLDVIDATLADPLAEAVRGLLGSPDRES